ncbi:MAG: nucleotidyltransferase domain-containing protein [Sedimentisphaerales bacterium]
MAAELNQDVLKTINAYLNVLREHHLSFESVWLFGSFAENRAFEDSDIDIAMVMTGVKNKFYKELELTKYRRGVDSRIEPHIINADDIDSPLYKEVTKRGIRIA